MTGQEKETQKKRLREKIEKHLNHLQLWDFLQIYLSIQWYQLLNKSNWLASLELVHLPMAAGQRKKACQMER